MEISPPLASVQASWKGLWYPEIVLVVIKRPFIPPSPGFPLLIMNRNGTNRN